MGLLEHPIKELLEAHLANMKISLADIGKHFNRDWIFRKLSYTIEDNTVCAIVGPNGSGKSTLLKIIAQAELPSEGKVNFTDNNQIILAEKAYQHISFAAPYIDLPEQLSFKEFFEFNQQFKPLKKATSFDEFASIVFLEDAKDKQILYFSSGMKQRLKLGISILSKSPILILDEPTANLDEEGVAFYQKILKENYQDRIVLIGSNEAEKDLSLATKSLSLTEYKN